MLLLPATSEVLQATLNQGSVTARRCIRSEIYRSAGEDATPLFPTNANCANNPTICSVLFAAMLVSAA